MSSFRRESRAKSHKFKRTIWNAVGSWRFSWIPICLRFIWHKLVSKAHLLHTRSAFKCTNVTNMCMHFCVVCFDFYACAVCFASISLAHTYECCSPSLLRCSCAFWVSHCSVWGNGFDVTRVYLGSVRQPHCGTWYARKHIMIWNYFRLVVPTSLSLEIILASNHFNIQNNPRLANAHMTQ